MVTELQLAFFVVVVVLLLLIVLFDGSLSVASTNNLPTIYLDHTRFLVRGRGIHYDYVKQVK
jgi:hypothetical protein